MSRPAPAVPLGITAAISVAPQLLAVYFGLYYRLAEITHMGEMITWIVPLACAVAGGLIGGAVATGPGMDPKPFRKAHIIQGIVTVFAGWILPRFGIYGSPLFFAIVTGGVGVGAALIFRPKAGREPRIAPATVASGAPLAPAASGGCGKKLFKLVQVAIVLGAIGGTGYAIWWQLGRVERESRKLLESSWVVSKCDETEWLVGRGDDERVMKAFGAQLGRIVEARRYGKNVNDAELDQVARAFAKRAPPPSAEGWVELATRAFARGATQAPSWIPGWETDARVVDALIKELNELGTNPSFNEEVIAAELPVILAEFEKRKVPTFPGTVDAIASIAVRRRVKPAEDWILGFPDAKLANQALAHEVAATAVVGHDEKAFAAAARLLLARKAPPDEELVKGVGDAWGFSFPPEVIELAKSWGPDGVKRMRALKDALGAPRKEVLLILARTDPRAEDVPAMFLMAATGAPWIERETVDKEPGLALAVPIDSRYEPNKYNEEVRKALVAIGAKAKAEIAKGLDHPSRAVAWTCAHALADIEPGALVDAVEPRIDLYNRRYPALAVARTEVTNGDPHAASAARRIAVEVQPLAQGVAEGLLALETMVGLADAESKGTDRADLCFMRALSSTEESLAKYAANVLKTRLDLDRFIDTLFKYLARKEQFSMAEVDVYEGALTSQGEKGSAGIVRNLERLLAAAGGKPERVFWIHKAIGLRCLVRVGDEDALPIIDAFSKDPGGYVHTETKVDRRTGQVTDKKETPVLFRSVCDDAREAIAKRKKK